MCRFFHDALSIVVSNSQKDLSQLQLVTGIAANLFKQLLRTENIEDRPALLPYYIQLLFYQRSIYQIPGHY